MIHVLALFFPFIALVAREMFMQATFNFLLNIVALLLCLTGGALLDFIFGLFVLFQKENKKKQEEIFEEIRQTKR